MEENMSNVTRQTKSGGISKKAIIVLVIYLVIAILLGIGRTTLSQYVSIDSLKLPFALGFLLFFFIPTVFLVIALYLPPKMRFIEAQIIRTYYPSPFVIHLAIMLVMMSFNQDLLPINPNWKIEMTGLGVALLALSLELIKQESRKSESLTTEDFQSHISYFSTHISDMDSKLDHLEQEFDTIGDHLRQKLSTVEKQLDNLILQSKSIEISVIAKLDKKGDNT
jgi:hypothetical protein